MNFCSACAGVDAAGGRGWCRRDALCPAAQAVLGGRSGLGVARGFGEQSAVRRAWLTLAMAWGRAWSGKGSCPWLWCRCSRREEQVGPSRALQLELLQGGGQEVAGGSALSPLASVTASATRVAGDAAGCCLTASSGCHPPVQLRFRAVGVGRALGAPGTCRPARGGSCSGERPKGVNVGRNQLPCAVQSGGHRLTHSPPALPRWRGRRRF